MVFNLPSAPFPSIPICPFVCCGRITSADVHIPSTSEKKFTCSKSFKSTTICITLPARLCFTIEIFPSVFRTLANCLTISSLSCAYSNTLWQIIISKDSSANLRSSSVLPVICVYWLSAHPSFTLSSSGSMAVTSLCSAK